jgi:DNA (cytosine-5)-methyltransferase 1
MTISFQRAISLFSNCGAGDVGYRQAGFRFNVMSELDPRRLEVCLLNHPGAVGVPGDLRETWPRVIEAYREQAGDVTPALLAACPPCQGMSSARGDRGLENDADAGSRDARNLLVTVIAHVTKALSPRIVIVENVPAFLTRKIRHPETELPISAAKLLIETLDTQYQVFPVLVDLCDFGVPQTRRRAFLTFIRSDVASLTSLLERQQTPYPIPSHAEDYGGQPITLRRALRSYGLPSLDAATAATATSNEGGGLHTVPTWTDRRYPMVSAIPKHSGHSAWENNLCEGCGEVDVDDKKANCPKCSGPLLRPVVKAKNGRYRLVRGFHSSSYTRMKSDEPAFTIITASGHIGSDHTIHPFENRLMSTLECSYLQTFPTTFKWGDALTRWGHTNIRSMIGEAVPPLFTEQHGRVLQCILRNDLPENLIAESDSRCRIARKKLKLKTSSAKKKDHV